MSVDNDRSLGERVANIEGTVEQMNIRLDGISGRLDQLDARLNQMDGRIDRLDGKIDQTRRDIRNWLVLVVLATSLITSVVVAAFQFLL